MAEEAVNNLWQKNEIKGEKSLKDISLYILRENQDITDETITSDLQKVGKAHFNEIYKNFTSLLPVANEPKNEISIKEKEILQKGKNNTESIAEKAVKINKLHEEKKNLNNKIKTLIQKKIADLKDQSSNLIEAENEFVGRYLGKYPVINLTFGNIGKNIDENKSTVDEIKRRIRLAIRNAFDEHLYLLKY